MSEAQISESSSSTVALMNSLTFIVGELGLSESARKRTVNGWKRVREVDNVQI
jgi:hypothetical protein